MISVLCGYRKNKERNQQIIYCTSSAQSVQQLFLCKGFAKSLSPGPISCRCRDFLLVFTRDDDLQYGISIMMRTFIASPETKNDARGKHTRDDKRKRRGRGRGDVLVMVRRVTATRSDEN